MKIKTSELTGPALDWAVAKCEFKSHTLHFVRGSEYRGNLEEYTKPRFMWVKGRATPCTLQDAEHLYEIEAASYYSPSRSWGIGGPIIEREDISTIRCDDDYQSFPDKWMAQKGKNSFSESTEHQQHDPMIQFGIEPDGRWGAAYGPTALVAAMRCYVASKLGEEVEVPGELIGGAS